MSERELRNRWLWYEGLDMKISWVKFAQYFKIPGNSESVNTLALVSKYYTYFPFLEKRNKSKTNFI